MDAEKPRRAENTEEDSVSVIENDKVHGTQEQMHHPKGPRNRQVGKSYNPLQRGINDYLTKHLPAEFFDAHNLDAESLISSLPKRYSLYPPLLLLPAKALSATPQWQAFISALDDTQLQALYASIATSFSSRGVTHIATNAPITCVTAAGTENKMRSPTGLVPLYGDFGPTPSSDAENDAPRQQLQKFPAEANFSAALWVRTVQNAGIVQIWAPLYSMFSRGNVVEKARILGLGKDRFDGLDERELEQPVRDIAVVDMYTGIGYFVFSYLKGGVGRVWAWEINAWSIEGLRRGCEENGWKIKVAVMDFEGTIEGGISVFVDGLAEEHRVVAFLGDNNFAAEVMGQLKVELDKRKAWKPVRHVNLGLLPSSRQSWDGAVKMLDARSPGWIHVHENMDINRIDAMKEDVSKEFESLLHSTRGLLQDEDVNEVVKCVHVEKVKTFAPGVMHCVFDMHVSPTASLKR